MKRLLVILAASSVSWLVANRASAVELLVGGDIEPAFVGWTLDEFITGSMDDVDTVEQAGFANEEGEIGGQAGLFLKPWAGGNASTQLNNAVLSQIVPGVAGETYTLFGSSKYEGNYAGGLEFLDMTSPHDPGMTGAVPSPTQGRFELAFLNASNAVIGTPIVKDLRTEQMNDRTWRQHTLMGQAPAGTANVRVTASMIDGVFNTDPQQSAFYDNFVLTAASAPDVDVLVNGNLNTLPSLPAEWILTEEPEGTDSASFAGFANHTPGGANGLWLRGFAGNLENNGADAILSQTVDAMPGGSYTFSGWARFEGNFSGGVDTLSTNSPFGAVPSPTETYFEIAFLDASEAVIGTPAQLDLRTVQTNDNEWHEHELTAVAPANAASVRVTAAALDMVFNTDPQQSAFFDDFSLDGPGDGTPGDWDGDGDVDGNDFVFIQTNLGGATTAADIETWKANYGTGGAGVAAAGAIPEPTSAVAALLAVIGLAGAGRRRS